MNTISTSNAPPAIGPYSQAVVADGVVYCSGQIAIHPSTGELVSGSVAAQTERVLHNLAAVLDAAGTGLHHVVKTTVFLSNMDDFAEMNGVYAAMFGEHRPARACVEAARLPKSVDVEIEAVAVVPVRGGRVAPS